MLFKAAHEAEQATILSAVQAFQNGLVPQSNNPDFLQGQDPVRSFDTAHGTARRLNITFHDNCPLSTLDEVIEPPLAIAHVLPFIITDDI